MKKRLIASLLVILFVVVLIVPAGAYTPEQERTADALNHLGLFLGNGVSYDLDGKLSRAQGVTLLIRMMGKEAEAEEKNYAMPFTDVADWAAPYVSYAYVNRITNGTGPKTFGSDEGMTDYMFLTLTLRALGYSDSGEKPQFAWDQPYELAHKIGLISKAEPDSTFIRGDAVSVFWNALNAKLAGTETTLAETLIETGVFTAEEFSVAVDTQDNGRTENPGVPVIPEDTTDSETTTQPDDTTGTEDPEDTPEIPDASDNTSDNEADDGNVGTDENEGVII